MERIRIRRGAREDAADVARMGNALNRELAVDGDPFTAEGVVKDGFGATPRFALLIAEVDGKTTGYAMYHAAYDSDIAAAAVRLVDLFVEASVRRLGVGRALMQAMARETVRVGAKTLEWGVHERNDRAIAFYRALGATGGSVRTLELRGDALSTLASERNSAIPNSGSPTGDRPPGIGPSR
jgi:diamine N-acetyltransferase